MWEAIKNYSTKHTGDTEDPQNVWKHGRIAFYYSMMMIPQGIGGMIHAIFPEIKRFQFSTSTFLFKAAKFLFLKSKRHNNEIREIFGEEWVVFIQQQRDKEEQKKLALGNR